MRKITKGTEPTSLTRWKSSNQGSYSDLTHIERQDIRKRCAEEQFFLCAYCCQSITGQNNDTMNEHVIARDIDPNLSLEFSNIVASCNSSNQCDDAHGNQPFDLTPFMDECETELRFSISGRVIGTTDRASETIRVLNLGDTETNNRALIEKRKYLTHAVLMANGVDPNDGIEDDELIQSVITDISIASNGKLESFSPIAIRVLTGWIGSTP